MSLEPMKTPASQVIQAIHNELDRLTTKSDLTAREIIVAAANNILDPTWQSWLIDWNK